MRLSRALSWIYKGSKAESKMRGLWVLDREQFI